jgi:hypothetical protein
MPLVGRRVLALALAACVPLGALCAPLVHAHADDHHDPHHDGSRVHAHLGGHGSARHQVRHDDHDTDHHVAASLDEHHSRLAEIEETGAREDVVRLQFFVAVDAHAFVAAGLQQGTYRLPPPLESVMRRPPIVVRSHGPPDRSPSASRAPPAHLS